VNDCMGAFGGFYKGDKKKKPKNKQGKGNSVSSNAPVFVMPKMVEKKKKNVW